MASTPTLSTLLLSRRVLSVNQSSSPRSRPVLFTSPASSPLVMLPYVLNDHRSLSSLLRAFHSILLVPLIFFLFVQNLAFLMSQYLDDDDNVVLPSEEDRPAVRRLYLNAIEMSLRCRTPNMPLYTAAQSFYSGQTCFLASSAILVPVQTICVLYPTSH